jgi:hypothetical protein
MSSMRAQPIPMLVVMAIACGEVPHPPKRTAIVHDAGHNDVSFDDVFNGDGPRRPLPLSEECTRCGTTPCLQVGVACVGDPLCQSCFSDIWAPGCLQNERFLDLARCACRSTCYDLCREPCDEGRPWWDTPDASP